LFSLVFNQDFEISPKIKKSHFPPTRLNFLDWSNLHNDSDCHVCRTFF
jgi:hypothetical protein